MLPLGSQMMCSAERTCKWDLDGNPIGCQLENPTMDTQLYDIKFHNGKVILLAANAIAQTMNAQCNVNRNEYLLLECFVNIQKDNTVIDLDEQKAVHNGHEYMCRTTPG